MRCARTLPFLLLPWLLASCAEKEAAEPAVEDAGFIFDVSAPDEGENPDTPAIPDIKDTTLPAYTPGLANSDWPMLGHDLQRSGRSAFVGTRVMTERWSKSVGGKISGSAAVLPDGRLVVGATNGNVIAVGPDGTESWTVSTDAAIEGSPAIGADGTTYIGSFDAFLYAIESNGTTRWKYETFGIVKGAPILHPDGFVAIGSRDNKVHAVDLNGRKAWTFATEGAIDGGLAMAPDGTLYAGSEDDSVYALDADGSAKWSFKTDGDVRANPVVGDDGTVYVASLLGTPNNVFALTASGAPRWKFNAEGGVEAPVALGLDNLVVVATQSGKLYGLSGDDGSTRFVTVVGAVGGNAIRAPMAVGADGLIYLSSTDTFAHVLDPKAGAEVASFSLGGVPSAGPAILSDGAVVFISDSTIRRLGGGGPCEGTPVSCDDGDRCTEDVCDPVTGCTNTFLCDDDNDCTVDACDEGGACTHDAVAAGLPCDDGIACTSGGACAGTDCVPAKNECGPALSTWPMRGASATHAGAVDYPAAQTGTIIWEAEAGAPISGSPVIDKAGRVYVGLSSSAGSDAKGALLALAANGDELWRFPTVGQVSATPAVTQYGTVYVGSRDGHLYAVTASGEEQWRYKTGEQVNSSPVISPEGTIYVGSGDGKLHAVGPDGVALWTWAAGAAISSTPALDADGNIYVGTEGGVLAKLDTAGKPVWLAAAGVQIGASSPVIGPDGTVFIGSFDKRLYAIKPDGTERWFKITGGPIEGSPALLPGNGVVIGSPDSRIYAYDANGIQRWNFQTNGQIVGSPAVGSDGTVYIGTIADVVADLYVIDAEGQERFRLKLPGGVFSQPAIGSDGRVIVASFDGRITAFGGGGTCEGESAPTCVDDDLCTADSCVEGTGCEHDAFCDDANVCTQDLCDAAGLCFYLPAPPGTQCDDGLACTLDDACFSGVCEQGETECPTMDSVWPVRGGNVQRTANSTVNGPIGQTVKWVFATDLRFDGGGPVVAKDGMIYTGSCQCTETESFCNAENVQQVCVSGVCKGGKCVADTCLASPADGILCIGDLFAISSTGEAVWKTPTGDAIQSTPTIGTEGTIYVGNNAGVFHAIYPNGDIKWKFVAGGQIRTSPILGGQGLVYFGAKDGKVYTLKPDGTLLWQFATGADVRTGLAQSADGKTVYAGSSDSNLYALDALSGQQIWKKPIGGVPRTVPLVDGAGRIHIGTIAGNLAAIESDGTPAYTFSFGKPITNDLALAPGGQTILVPVSNQFAELSHAGTSNATIELTGLSFPVGALVDPSGAVYVVGSSGSLYAFQAPFFTQKWSYNVKDPAVVGGIAVPTGSLAVTEGGLLLIPSKDGKLFAAGP